MCRVTSTYIATRIYKHRVISANALPKYNTASITTFQYNVISVI